MIAPFLRFFNQIFFRMLRGCGPVVADGQGPAAEASRLRLRQRRGLLPGWGREITFFLKRPLNLT